MVRKRERAFALYLKTDLSLRKVAEEIGVSVSSVERWSKEDGWNIRRKRLWLESSKEALEEAMDQRISEIKTMYGKVYSIMIFAYSQHEAYRSGKIPKKALKYSARDFQNFLKAYALAGMALEKSLLDKELAKRITF